MRLGAELIKERFFVAILKAIKYKEPMSRIWDKLFDLWTFCLWKIGKKIRAKAKKHCINIFVRSTLLVSLNSENCDLSVWTQSGSLSPASGVNMSPDVGHNDWGQRCRKVWGVFCKRIVTHQCIHPGWSCRLHPYQCLLLFPTKEKVSL